MSGRQSSDSAPGAIRAPSPSGGAHQHGTANSRPVFTSGRDASPSATGRFPNLGEETVEKEALAQLSPRPS